MRRSAGASRVLVAGHGDARGRDLEQADRHSDASLFPLASLLAFQCDYQNVCGVNFGIGVDFVDYSAQKSPRS